MLLDRIDIGDEHAILQELKTGSRTHGKEPNRSRQGCRD